MAVGVTQSWRVDCQDPTNGSKLSVEPMDDEQVIVSIESKKGDFSSVLMTVNDLQIIADKVSKLFNKKENL